MTTVLPTASPAAGQRRRRRDRRAAAGGYALFEALIAVIVLSLGFIGAARMQTVGLKLNNSAHVRQKASLLAYQMTDRIRANAAAAYVGARPGDTACLANVAGCTPGAMASADLAEWQGDLAAQLPAGAGVVCLDSAPNAPSRVGASAADPKCDNLGNTTVVKVFWSDTVATGGSVFTTPVRAQ